MELPTLTVIPGRGIPGLLASDVSGGRDQWSEPLPSDPPDAVAAAWDCLREVLDPEIPISLVDLGLIYDLKVGDRVATVSLTYTATACPCMAFINEDITDRLEQEQWLDRVEIQEVWDPPWSSSRITPEGRVQLRALGVAL